MEKIKSLIKKMYSNIGDKLCKIAIGEGIVGLLSIVVGIVLAVAGLIDYYDELFIGGLIVAGSGIVVIISSWPLYAFGQITNDVHSISEK
jgi:hypothetical protein